MNECYRYVSYLFSCKLIEAFSFLNETFGCCDVWKNVLLKFKSSVGTFLVKTYWMDFYVYDLLLLLCV